VTISEFPPSSVVTKTTRGSVEATLARLIDIITTRDLKIFALIDLAKEAHRVGIDLPETVIVMFGAPRLGVQVIAASPLAALDLPLKILLWSEESRTSVSYELPHSFSRRHNLQSELESKLNLLNSVADALVASV
jgi:uncharacterized protein (DUF302 family)